MESQSVILAIETSCDETSAAVVIGNGSAILVASNIVSSQVSLHAEWGGVVPNLAAREHVKNIVPVVLQALRIANISSQDIDCIAVTNRPGLIPALLVGTSTAKTLAWLWKKPLLGIHHIEGHIYANCIRKNHVKENTKAFPSNNNASDRIISFPALALIVSGGHTQIVLMRDHSVYEIVGETQDDAAGEAFDKTARLLDLGYPGGPKIALEAEKYQKQLPLTIPQIKFPRPMFSSKDYNFSFSGLKTAVLNVVQKISPENLKLLKPEICHEFQQAVIDVLIHKTAKAILNFQPKTVLLAGGVSANVELRKQLGEKIKNDFPTTSYLTPFLEYSIDNAAMIGAAAYFRWSRINSEDRAKAIESWKTLETSAHERMK